MLRGEEGSKEWKESGFLIGQVENALLIMLSVYRFKFRKAGAIS